MAERVFEMMLPPSLVVDSNLNILQVINDINPYVALRAGKFNQSLNNLVTKELSAIINNVVRRLKANHALVTFEGVRIDKGDTSLQVNIEGRLLSEENGSSLVLISFVEPQKLTKNILPKML